MQVFVFSQSASFNQHVKTVMTDSVSFKSNLELTENKTNVIYIVHAESFPDQLLEWLARCEKIDSILVGVATDKPSVEKMLESNIPGTQAYFNSYMAKPHYQQMLRLLDDGLSCYPPELLSQVLKIARKTIENEPKRNSLEALTPREREIALAVAQGQSNKAVAKLHGVSEVTVKAHLTHIFEKLHIQGRVALAIYINH
jgi:DNA-binding NarL/FixJ family response regulator